MSAIQQTAVGTTPATVAEVPPEGVPPQRRRVLTPRARLSVAGGYLLLVGLALVYVYPFLISIASSMKTDADATGDPLSLIPPPGRSPPTSASSPTCRCRSGR
ncbi:hypothetical protein CMsap09_15025 [Clavibacter michiganensis]|uniref:Uncharacterized protein n=1 Tax=Clavibacter michiganensis TaxID=28447 RepID=A0A251XYA2_9MICO|nr:hypothetical protein CMsap09_15025 [Clavibacter michiganensis]